MEKIGEKLLRFEKNQKYLCFDTETLSLSLVGYKNNRPWQISWRTFSLKKDYENFDFYMNIGAVPNLEIQKLTNYSQRRMDEEGRDPKEIYQLFAKYLYDPNYIVVGHNILGFDIYMLNQLANSVGLKHDYSYLGRSIDTLNLAKAYRFKQKVERDNLYLWQRKMGSMFQRGMKCKLGDLAKEFDIPFEEEKCHDASYDIELNEKVFKELLYKVEI